ncbi:hypothetical protein M2140_000052 [Clostridiales Family XIII bacterium PM5-7]
MDFSKLCSYRFFDFQLPSPSILCRFQKCAASSHDDIIRFYTGEMMMPVCMLVFNISTSSLRIGYGSESIDVLYFTLEDEREYIVYAHK